jgi:TPR repeat protein
MFKQYPPLFLLLFLLVGCSDVNEANELLQRGLPNEAIILLEQEHLKDDVKAQQLLAQAYLKHNYILGRVDKVYPYPLSSIIPVLIYAAQRGNVESQYKLGLLADVGLDFGNDTTTVHATNWMQMAAKNRHPQALQNMGRRLIVAETNKPTDPQTMHQALMFFNLSLKHGNSAASTDIDFLKHTTTKHQFEQANKAAKTLADQWENHND